MSKSYIVKVKTDLTIEKVEFNAEDSLTQLQEAVGGCILRVPADMKHDLDLWVNDEGLLLRKPLNGILSSVHSIGADRVELLVGDGVFACHDEEGETIGIQEDIADSLVEMLNEIKSAWLSYSKSLRKWVRDVR